LCDWIGCIAAAYLTLFCLRFMIGILVWRLADIKEVAANA
jgi:hypothetical protein